VVEQTRLRASMFLGAAAIALALALFVSSPVSHQYTWAGVVLLAVSFLIRRLATGRLLRRTPLHWPVLLFGLSGVLGVWAAYDRPVATVKLYLILSAIAIYFWLTSHTPLAGFSVAVAVGLALFGAALAVFFVTQNDFAFQSSKFSLITRIGMLVNRWVPSLPFEPPHPNRVAGVLAIILPLSAACTSACRQSHRALAAICAAASVVMGAGLIMTSSRGAWLALAVVVVGAAGAHVASRSRRVFRIALGAVLVLGALYLLAIIALAHVDARAVASGLLGGIALGDVTVSRLDVFEQASWLIRDYPFTGSGLGMFPMVYSTYALLIHVPFIPHAHNLFLQAWIEQGLLGFLALVWLVLALYYSAWRSRTHLDWIAVGGLLAASVIVVHGLVDAALYSNRVLPLMFAAFALAVPGAEDVRPSSAQAIGQKQQTGTGSLKVIVPCLAASAIALALSWQTVAALWYANAGSVLATRIELGQYKWPDRLVEYVRRDGDLAPAEPFWRQALTFDSENVTANQRLAEVALARAAYDLALDHAERAYRRDPSNTVTWQLLGDAYLAVGRLDDAYALWSRVPDAASKIEGTAWIRYEVTHDRERAQWATMLAERLRAQSAQEK